MYIYTQYHTVCSVTTDFAFHQGFMSKRFDNCVQSQQKFPTRSMTEQFGMFWPPAEPRRELTAQKSLFLSKEPQLFHNERDLSAWTMKRWTDRNIINMWPWQNCVHRCLSDFPEIWDWSAHANFYFFIQAVWCHSSRTETACFPYAKKKSPTTACFD